MRALVIVATAILLSGCATSRVALLNDEGNTSAGAVAVFDAKTEAERGVLNVANTVAAVGGKSVRPRAISDTAYSQLAAYIPAAPRSFVMYFLEGSTDLAPGSDIVLEALRKEVSAGSEVQITGHTDTVGTLEANDKLSLERASEVRAALVSRGLPVANARIVGRGEREPRVNTADEVGEAANRRVEVILR